MIKLRQLLWASCAALLISSTHALAASPDPSTSGQNEITSLLAHKVLDDGQSLADVRKFCDKRIATMPETPTVMEAGVADYELSFWTAIFAPAGTPAAIVARLKREINEILATAEVIKALAEQGVDADPTTPDALGALVRKETAKFRAVVEQAGIKPQ